jgi:hypothetical protein
MSCHSHLETRHIAIKTRIKSHIESRTISDDHQFLLYVRPAWWLRVLHGVEAGWYAADATVSQSYELDKRWLEIYYLTRQCQDASKDVLGAQRGQVKEECMLRPDAATRDHNRGSAHVIIMHCRSASAP